MRLLIILVTVVLAYWRTIKYKFIIDDHDHVKKPEERTPKLLKRVWEHFYGIKVTNLKLTHAFSVSIHALVCCLIYLVFGMNDIAFLTAMLFALNPVNNQCSIWLSGRAYAITTLLFLIGMLYMPLLPLFYGLASWWSIGALMTPLLFLVLKPWWLGLIIPLGLLLIKSKTKECYTAGMNRYKGTTEIMSEISFRKLIIVFKTLGYYFILCLFPTKLGMCHEYLSTFGLTKKETDKYMKLDLFFFIGIAVVLATLITRQFGLVWFLVFALPWLNMVVISHLISERYIYLSNIGLMYLLSKLIIGTPFMWIFLTFYAVRLFYFIPAYRDIICYWKSNTEIFPTVAMGWNQLGLAQLQFGNTGSALDSWIRGVQERPNDFRLNYNTANLLLGCGQAQESARFIKSAEENLDPKNGYDFWKDKVDTIKLELKKRGIDYVNPLPRAV
jgi:hypothetical protein